MFARFGSAPTPCLTCEETELKILHEQFKESGEEFWVYKVPVMNVCRRCDSHRTRHLWNSYAKTPILRNFCCVDPNTVVQVPIPIDVVGRIERAMHSSSTATTGSAFRAHSAFISLLATMECPERYKQALCCWMPLAMIGHLERRCGYSRILRKGHQAKAPDCPEVQIDCTPMDAAVIPPANPGTENGMVGTQCQGDEYGAEERLNGDYFPTEPKILAHQIGPDLIPTEVMDGSAGNLKAGLAKRVQPLPFTADKAMVRKIERFTNMMLKEVFSPEKIRNWRVDNPIVEEFCSSKWTGERFRQAFEEAMAETNAKIEQTFQIKVNEALPANEKAPRPIIQCGDRAQVMMALPVKCFEDLLFEHFEAASIKHLSKYDAMVRVSQRLKQGNANLVEGDGSAWDSCCNPRIRGMTENRIIRQIIEVLGEDPEIPKGWMQRVLDDMEKPKLKGKAKVSDFNISPLKITIDAIRQSGHRGTSCFNYLINLTAWLCVLCDNPEKMIKKDRAGNLKRNYISAFDGKLYYLTYAFEGDDSAISTTENLRNHEKEIEALWTQMGFRMKLVYVLDKLTFTGFDFLCDKNGPTGVFLPEIARNVSSSSWTTSSLVKQFPGKKYEVGAAAMLARAENFKDCGPFSAYFAALGLAHCQHSGDREINDAEAKALGINVSPSVKKALQELYDSAGAMSKDMRKLVSKVVDISPEQQDRMLTADFGNDPLDLPLARRLIPFAVWNPANFKAPRR